MSDLVLHDYAASPNCLKVRILLGHIGRPYRRRPVDIFGGETLGAAFATLNPARQVPVLETRDGVLVQSGAILWYLAAGTAYLPFRPADQGQVVRWLLFEQDSVSAIAGLRFRLQAGLLSGGDRDAQRRRRDGDLALRTLDDHLRARPFLVADAYTIADIACYAYVHVADEAGHDLAQYPAVVGWLRRIEATPGFHNDLVPLPGNARPGRGLSIYG
jgi:glutathione S-transferase